MSKIEIEFYLLTASDHPRWATIIFLQNANPIAYFTFNYNLETCEHTIGCTVYSHCDPNRWNQHIISKIGEQYRCSQRNRHWTPSINWSFSIKLSEFSELFRLLKQAANVT